MPRLNFCVSPIVNTDPPKIGPGYENIAHVQGCRENPIAFLNMTDIHIDDMKVAIY